MPSQTVRVIDSHTGGEPTRIVVAGGPQLTPGSTGVQRDQLREQFDWFRRSIILEPRGTDYLVGGLLVEHVEADCDVGVIFFNNVGYLGMCGHGTIGLIETLAYLDRIRPGRHRVETPAGVITAQLHHDRSVSIENVPSYRYATDVVVETATLGRVQGDIAWGGNWFFLASGNQEPLKLSNIARLTKIALEIRSALQRQQITGADGGEIDHIELFGPPESSEADSRNFVLCPGGAYDRSPCGTGTSAKVACLIASGDLKPGDVYRQESITGSIFTAVGRQEGNQILPTITGRAHVYAETTLIIEPDDPLRHGVDV